MEGEFLLTILAGGFLFFICKWAGDKRAQVTRRCPKCGTTCNASRWSTGLRYAGGGDVYSFKCPNCGHSFHN